MLSVILFPKPPKGRKPWVAQLTILASVFVAIGVIGSVISNQSKLRAVSTANRFFGLVGQGRPVGELPTKMLTNEARSQAIELERSRGPVRGWTILESYADLFNPLGHVQVLVRRSHCDDSETLEVNSDGVILTEERDQLRPRPANPRSLVEPPEPRNPHQTR